MSKKNNRDAMNLLMAVISYYTSNLRVGKRFARNVITAVREKKLLYREAYRLTGLHHETFETYAKELSKGDTA